MPVKIGDTEILDFWRDGAVKLSGLFALPWIDKLRTGVEKNFADPGPDACRYTKENDPGGFYDDYCNWTRIGPYSDFVRNSPAGEIAGRLLESSAVRIYHEHVLVKEPGTRQVTPWHQDLPYYGVEGNKLCSIWLPLDPVPLQACPQFIAGSHATGDRYVPKLFKDQQPYGDTITGYADIPDFEADRGSHRILSWDLQIGDCLVFHMATVHSAPGTVELKSRRRGFSTRWLGDDAVFAERPWPTSPPFRNLTLEPGDNMQHELFPVVWQAEQ